MASRFSPWISELMRQRQQLFRVFLLAPLVYLWAFGNRFLYLGLSRFSDLTISHYPNLLYLKRALMEWREIPLWSPAILSGTPFFANPLSGLWYPPGWLAMLIPAPLVFNLLAGLHLSWGALGLYLFLRQEGLRHWAAVFGGLAFGMMPKLFGHFGAGHLTLVYAVPWTPWLLWASNHKIQKRGFSRLLSKPGVILAVLFFADVRWAAYAGLVWLTWESSRRRRAGLRESLKLIVTQLTLAAGLSAPLALPLWEYLQLSTRNTLQVQDIFAFSLPPSRLLGLIYPDIGGLQEWILYPGVVVLLLALLGLAWKPARFEVKFWYWMIFGTLVFSLGANLPLVSNLGRLPGMSLLRVPARALFLSGMGFAVVGAWSLDHLCSGLQPFERRMAMRVLFVFAGLVVFLSLGLWIASGKLLFAFGWSAGVAITGAILVALASGKRPPNPAWAGLLIGVCLLDWSVVNGRSLVPHPAEEILSEGRAVAEFISSQEGRFRVYSPSYSLPLQTAAVFGLQQADGVDPLQLASYVAFMERASGVPRDGYSVTLPPFKGDVSRANQGYMPDAALLGVLNVRYVAADFEVQAEGLQFVDQIGGTWIYENALARGPAWVQEDGESLEKQVLRGVEELNWSPNRISLHAEGPGFLVLSELAYPGWRVRVDGQPAEMVEVDNLLRGVSLRPGKHEVEFSFWPLSLPAGLALFVFTCTFLVWDVAKAGRSALFVPLISLRPNNWYINREKLDQVMDAWETGQQDSLPPVLVTEIDGEWSLIDGHSRALAAYRSGKTEILAVFEKLEQIDGDTRLYRHIHRAGPGKGIRSIHDLESRVLDPEDHERLWIGYCKAWLKEHEASSAKNLAS